MKHGALTARLLLAGVFLSSGLIKASGSSQFAIALAPFTLMPQSWLRPLSILLPCAEIAAGCLLVLPWTKRLGAVLVVGLCLVFITVLGWAMANGIVVSCSCFGEDEEPSLAKMTISLLRDIVLAALAVIVLFEDQLRALRRRQTPAQETV